MKPMSIPKLRLQVLQNNLEEPGSLGPGEVAFLIERAVKRIPPGGLPWPGEEASIRSIDRQAGNAQ